MFTFLLFWTLMENKVFSEDTTESGEYLHYKKVNLTCTTELDNFYKFVEGVSVPEDHIFKINHISMLSWLHIDDNCNFQTFLDSTFTEDTVLIAIWSSTLNCSYFPYLMKNINSNNTVFVMGYKNWPTLEKAKTDANLFLKYLNNDLITNYQIFIPFPLTDMWDIFRSLEYDNSVKLYCNLITKTPNDSERMSLLPPVFLYVIIIALLTFITFYCISFTYLISQDHKFYLD